MGGLFHNVGVLAVISAARRHSSRSGIRPSARGVVEVIHRFGYRYNGEIVKSWRLPQEVLVAVTGFRTWFMDPAAARIACLTELVNDISKDRGLWVEQKPFGEHLQRQLGHLGLTMLDLPSAERLKELITEVEETASLI